MKDGPRIPKTVHVVCMYLKTGNRSLEVIENIDILHNSSAIEKRMEVEGLIFTLSYSLCVARKSVVNTPMLIIRLSEKLEIMNYCYYYYLHQNLLASEKNSERW